MLDEEFIHSWVTYTGLGGRFVSEAEITSELSNLPLDGALGFLALLSNEILKKSEVTIDPRWQAQYLNMALVDDFPSPLPRASTYYAPGCVPYTGEEHILIHNHNLALLAHLVTLSCRTDQTTPTINYKLKLRLCRLLLIVNDLIAHETEMPGDDLIARREFCRRWLRIYQYGISGSFRVRSRLELARQEHIFSLIEQSGATVVNEAFSESTGGESLSHFWSVRDS